MYPPALIIGGFWGGKAVKVLGVHDLVLLILDFQGAVHVVRLDGLVREAPGEQARQVLRVDRRLLVWLLDGP